MIRLDLTSEIEKPWRETKILLATVFITVGGN